MIGENVDTTKQQQQERFHCFASSAFQFLPLINLLETSS